VSHTLSHVLLALQLCSPVMAAPVPINPVSVLAANPIKKAIDKAGSMDAPRIERQSGK